MSFGCATRKEKRRRRQRRRRKEERSITLPVVSSNEGASTVFFTPNKRFILVRESLFVLSVQYSNCCEDEVPSEKQEEEEGNFLEYVGATLLWHS